MRLSSLFTATTRAPREVSGNSSARALRIMAVFSTCSRTSVQCSSLRCFDQACKCSRAVVGSCHPCLAGEPVRLSSFVVVTILLSACIAHADTFRTFQFSIRFEPGTGVAGQIVLDTTTDQFTSIGGFSGNLPTGNSFYTIASQGTSNGDYSVEALGSAYPLRIVLPVTTLAGYNGSVVCTETLGPDCFASSTLIFPAISGSLTPLVSSTVTPEPSSIALLATGLVGVAGVLRRRLA